MTIIILAPIIILALILFICIIIRHEIHCNETSKNVLQAIKELGIEDELARCPFGVTPKLFISIKTYLRQHNLPDPFDVGIGEGFALTGMVIVIGELRKKGKIKQLYTGVNNA